jgi:predicted AlkP superfamily pyrophosphatase or phosphodiesterase
MKHILVFISIFLFTFSANAQQPKLVVGIVVDQMRYDYINRYWSKFGNDGFKRLVNEGFFCRNTNYNYVPTYTAPGHASIYTGTTPSVNGIIANNWYDKDNNSWIYCVDDKTVQSVEGNEKAGQLSPRNMFSTTIGDQLKLSNNFRSKVIGIALKDRGAILPAGHTGNAAYWYDGATGNWMTSTYYMKELPKWVQEFNKRETPKRYLSNTWTTLLAVEQYTESTADDTPYEWPFKGLSKPVFPYKLNELMAANDNLNLIRNTPYGNSLTKDFAIETITGENMGKGNVTDFIAISFSSTDYIGHQFGPNSIEVEDTYLRLDKDIAEFLKFLDTWVGKDNVLLFLTADHGAGENPNLLKDHNIPVGGFDEKELAKKIKLFLYSLYNDSLVLSLSNQQVFLNHKVINDKKLNPEEIGNKIAEFVLREKGVANAYTSYNISNWGNASDLKTLIQNGYNQKRSGDVVINFLPNWMSSEVKYGTSHGSPYPYDTHVPLIFYGYTVKAGSTNEAVAISDIAPTLSILLNIEVPNGCTGKAITISK